jgi:N utilization substance protein A
MQQIRRAEKAMIFTEFKDRVGDIISGTVRRFERSDVYVDLGKYEALLPNKERVPTEEYQVGERIRCYVKAVEQGPHGPEIILSRADPRFVIKLFQVEVSEISDGTIEIKGIAREPGFRTKLAVWTRDEKVDPVGACVGLRGQRVKNIVRELNNEKVDIIKWSPNVRDFVTNALAPGQAQDFRD